MPWPDHGVNHIYFDHSILIGLPHGLTAGFNHTSLPIPPISQASTMAAKRLLRACGLGVALLAGGATQATEAGVGEGDKITVGGLNSPGDFLLAK
jgi:hypothetical protein